MQLFSNFTGSVAWYRRVIEWMLGLRADFDALRIDPRPPAAWDEYTVHKLWRGRSIHARFRRTDRPDLTVTLNGRPAHATIPLGDLSPEGVNEIIVEFGRGR
jgi:cellobiose phosphorylase